MNVFKKSLLISTSLLGIVHGAVAMNGSLEEDNTQGNGPILKISPSSPGVLDQELDIPNFNNIPAISSVNVNEPIQLNLNQSEQDVVELRTSIQKVIERIRKDPTFYTSRLMSENPSLEDLEKIKPRELGIFARGDELFCKAHEQKEELRIAKSGNPNDGLSSDIVERILNTVKATQNIERKDEGALFQYTSLKGYTPIAQRVIVLGPTGSGKTTFINGLAGKLKAEEEEAGGKHLDAVRPLPGFKISHDGVGTTLPTAWLDEESNIVYWDCPGFGDLRGPSKDILNAFAIDQLFHGSSVTIALLFKESFLEERAAPFLKLLNETTELFSDDYQLQQGISLVITRQRDKNPYARIKQIWQREEGSLDSLLTLRARKLLKFLSENANRVSPFPYPQQEGEYQFKKQDMLSSIGAAQFISNPTFTPSVAADARELIGKFARRLNEEITHLIRTEIAQGIKSFCEKQIHKHSGFVGELRENLQEHATKLEVLQNTSQENPLVVANGLQLFSDTSVLRRNIEHISFLKRINPDISYSIGEWSIALGESIEQVRRFTSVPKEELNNDVLNITGNLLGITDVQRAMKVCEGIIRKVEAKSDSFLLIDKDIKNPGMHLSFKAPFWRVIGTRVIDISGKPGETEGLAGGNGGNFEGYGDIFGRKNLTIKLNGGNGANGKDGTDAEICYVKDMVQDGENDALIFRQKYTNRSLGDFVMNWGLKLIFTVNSQYIEIYETNGTPGTPGGKAGQGGVGRIVSKTSNLIEGLKGENGLPGKKGKDGKTYSGVYFAEYVLGGLLVSEKDGDGERAKQTAMEASKQVGKQVGVQAAFETGKQAVFETGKQAVFETGKQAVFETGKQAVFETGKRAVFETGKQAVFETGKQAVFETGKQAVFETGKRAVFETGKQMAMPTMMEMGKQVGKTVGPSLLFTALVSPIVSRLSSYWKEGPNHISRLEDLTDEIKVRQELEKWAVYMNIYESFLSGKRKILIKQIQEEMPHISEGFITTVLANHFNGPNEGKEFNLTGSPLSKQTLRDFITYMDLSTYVYTNKSTKSSPGKRYPYSVQKNWREIIGNQKEITRLYNNLLTISGKDDKILGKDLVYEQKGTKTIPSREVLAFSIDALTPELEKRYGHWLESVNHFLVTINKNPITYKKLSEGLSAKKELVDVFSAINDEYSLHFGASSPSSTPQFKYTDEDVHQPTNEAVIAASFLDKTSLLKNENVTILGVGFRNLEKISGLMNGVRQKVVDFLTCLGRINPYTDSMFPELGEVDYIAYIEKDTTLEKKDKLFIVYTGSNSKDDWIRNFTFGWTRVLNLSVHEGIGNLFNDSQENYLPSLIDSVKRYYFTHQKPKNFEIITMGHSLGGGLAPLAAYYFKTKQQEGLKDILNLDSKDKVSVKTFTFGAPAIVDQASKGIMERELGKDNIFRVWTFEDPVVNKTDDSFFQRSVHVGRSFPLYNIDNLATNLFSNIRGEPHSLGYYRSYLQALDQENPSLNHQKLTFTLTKYISELYVPKGIAQLRELQREIGKKKIPNAQDQNSDLGDKTPVDEEDFFSFKEIGSRESAIVFPALEADEWDSDLPIKQESLKLAEEQGEVGPRTIPGWHLHDVEDNGNCFYEAVAHQMQIIRHSFLNEIPSSTLPHDSLRSRIQGENFKDKEWAEDEHINKCVEKFDVILAIVDTRKPENGYTYYYLGEDGEVITHTRYYNSPLPNKSIVRLAATGNHFLSVLSDPFLGQWN